MNGKKSRPRDYGGSLAGGLVGFVASRMVGLGFFVGRWIPIRLYYRIAVGAVWIFGLLFPSVRRAVSANMRTALCEEVAPSKMRRLVRDVLSNTFARKWIDIFVLHRLTKDFVEDHVEVVGREKYQRALDQGRGVLLITWHLGSQPILCYLALPHLGGSVLAPFRRIFDDPTEAKLRATARSHGGDSVYPGGPVKPIIRQLKSGGTVVLAGDHLTSPTGLRVNYFGRETLMPAGPATLACRYRPVTMACYCIRTAADRFRVEFSDPFEIPQFSGKADESHILDFARQYIRYYEDVVRRHPSQWECFLSPWPASFREEDLQTFYAKFGVMT